MGSQKIAELGELEIDLHRFLALAGLVLPSRASTNSCVSVLRASSKSRLISPHVARYSCRFDRGELPGLCFVLCFCRDDTSIEMAYTVADHLADSQRGGGD